MATAAEQAKDAYITLATQLAGDPDTVIAALRERYDTWTEQCFEIPDGTRIEPCRLGDVDALRVIADGVDSDLRLLHFHGGGYVVGSPHGYRAFAARLSAGIGAEVLLPAYRLAPEHGPDAPVEDAVGAYRALCAQESEPADVVISGDSAGGGLALAALIALRDAGDPPPAAGVALSPWTDATLSGASLEENAEHDLIIPPAFLSTLALLRFGGDGDRTDPRYSPAFADWHGVSPLLLFASSTESLRDDAVTVAERAQAADVNAQLEIYDGMVHVWPFFSETLDEGQRAIDQIAAFVHACTSPPIRTR
jgi:monoterpene epsilon-lactone hydrolase